MVHLRVSIIYTIHNIIPAYTSSLELFYDSQQLPRESQLHLAGRRRFLRGTFKAHEYGAVILPFVVLRRLDLVLEPQKVAVIKQ
jgi:hypothetical protein